MSSFAAFVAKAFILTLTISSTISAQKILPGAYIVEFADDANTNPLTFLRDIASQGIAATQRTSLDHELFKGVSFKLDVENSVENVSSISNLASVKQIWPVRLYDRPATVLGTLDNSAALRTSPLETTKSKRSISDNFSPHVMAGVDRLHDLGYTGDGLFIGVVDTGVDYLHPALGEGFGPGYKIVTGTDLVGDAYSGSNTPIPDNDPMDCGGHGTHVSGIIAAGPQNPFSFTGVAPNATLGMWKVFGCEGSVANDILIAAFNLAYEAGVDIISASIGGPSGWTEDAWDVAVQRIAEKGTPCIISNGNDGANGLYDSSTSAESIGAIGVGSVDNIYAPTLLTAATYSVDSGAKMQFGYAQSAALGDFRNTITPVYAPTLDASVTADGCTPFATPGFDLSSYSILIKRGSCTFDTKIANAVAIGAKRILFYNNSPTGATAPGDTSQTIPAGMVTLAQGTSWINTLKAGSKLVIQFTAAASSDKVYNVTPNTASGGKMSTFSSWGMSFENWIKPEISAPGGLILSTYPRAKGSYAVLSGTSMAAPFIAGTVGLLKQIKGKRSLTPPQIGSLLASTATPLRYNNGLTTSSFLTPVIQQGGGLVDAYHAAFTKTIVNLDNIALNDTDHFFATHPIVITNTGDSFSSYKFTNNAAATVYTLSSGSIVPSLFGSIAYDIHKVASVTFVPPALAIPPKGSGIVIAQFKQPTGLDTTRFPVYSGFLQINGTNGDSLSIPYAGLAASSKNFKVMNTQNGYPYLATTRNMAAKAANNTTFVFSKPPTSADVMPVVIYELAMGSRIVRIDVVPMSATTAKTSTVLGTKTIGSISSYPMTAGVPRNELFTAKWDGSLADGTYAPVGQYKLVLRALKILGDQSKAADYETYELATMSISYK